MKTDQSPPPDTFTNYVAEKDMQQNSDRITVVGKCSPVPIIPLPSEVLLFQN